MKLILGGGINTSLQCSWCVYPFTFFRDYQQNVDLCLSWSLFQQIYPHIRWISPIGYFFHIPYFVFLRPLKLQFVIYDYSSEWKTKTGRVSNITLNFLSRQNESKILYITFQKLLNTVLRKTYTGDRWHNSLENNSIRPKTRGGGRVSLFRGWNNFTYSFYLSISINNKKKIDNRTSVWVCVVFPI